MMMVLLYAIKLHLIRSGRCNVRDEVRRVESANGERFQINDLSIMVVGFEEDRRVILI